MERHGGESIQILTRSHCLAINWTVCLSGGGERADQGHPQHLQRAVGVPGLLAHLWHYGGAAVQWPILRLLLPQRHAGGSVRRQQLQPVHGVQPHLEERQGQL